MTKEKRLNMKDLRSKKKEGRRNKEVQGKQNNPRRKNCEEKEKGPKKKE